MRKQVAALKTLNNSSATRQSEVIVAALEATPAFRAAHTVLLYYSLPDEVDTRPLFQRWHSVKQLLLPVVRGQELEIRRYTHPADLIVGAYGICEPTGDAFTDYNAIDLVVVPGIAFDCAGHRLGRGKGYYDRLLPRIPAHRTGLCFPFQLVDEVPAEAFDVPVDEVVTLNGTQSGESLAPPHAG